MIFKYIIYIILIALITMGLIYIGIIKDKTLNGVLINKLYSKCIRKVLKAFKTKENLSAKEIREIIEDEKSRVIWSKRKLSVTNSLQFSNLVIDGLIKMKKIELLDSKKRIYRKVNYNL